MSREEIAILEVRRRLGRNEWTVPRPITANDADTWVIDRKDATTRIIISHGRYPHIGDIHPWVHASISRRDVIPSYEELTMLHAAVWPDGWAYQVFAPPSAHVNIHPRALHLWGRPDGRALLPNFGSLGTI